MGQTADITETTRRLRDFSFTEVDYVYEPGQYAVRGSILDVYSFSCELPFRIDFFGVRPTEYTYTEDCGLYQEGNSYLYVTKGIGALIPFRFAVSPEIVVITLHRK